MSAEDPSRDLSSNPNVMMPGSGMVPGMQQHPMHPMTPQQQQQHGHQVNPHSMAPPQPQHSHHQGMGQGMPMHMMSNHPPPHYAPPPPQSGHAMSQNQHPQQGYPPDNLNMLQRVLLPF